MLWVQAFYIVLERGATCFGRGRVDHRPWGSIPNARGDQR